MEQQNKENEAVIEARVLETNSKVKEIQDLSLKVEKECEVLKLQNDQL